MKKSSQLAVGFFFVAMAASAVPHAAESTDQQSTSQQPARPNDSIKQGIKNDAAEAKQGIKRGAAEVKQGVKNGAAKVKRKLAVAQCNDGRYSYTHHLTCNHHGGVMRRFR